MALAIVLEPKCAELDKLLSQYYQQFGKKYSNEFAKYCDDNGYDDETLVDDLDGAPEETDLGTFDSNFPLEKKIDDETARNDKVLSILKYCVEKRKLPTQVMPTFDLNKLNLKKGKVTEKVIGDTKTKYLEQVPEISDACAKEPDVLYFLSARDVNSQFPVLPSLVDSYTRYRALTKFYEEVKSAPHAVH
eukprot:97512_1